MINYNELTKIGHLVKEIAQDELIPRFNQCAVSVKSDGSLLTEADIAIQQRLKHALHELYPDITFCAEEMGEENIRQIVTIKNDSCFWCVDPLDGTSNFAHGLPYFAISIGLICGGETVAGLVYDPTRDELFSALKGLGARLNNAAIMVRGEQSELKECLANVDFKRLPQNHAVLLATRPPYRSQRCLGAVALDWCWLAADRYQLYLHGGGKLWDYSAGLLIAHEAGCVSQCVDGSQVFDMSVTPRYAIAATSQKLLGLWTDFLSPTSV